MNRWAGLLLVTATLGGCLGSSEDVDQSGVGLPGVLQTLAYLPDGAPAPALALVEAIDAQGNTLWLTSTTLDGSINARVGTDVAQLIVYHGGLAYGFEPDGSLRVLEDVRGPPLGFGSRYEFPNPIFPVQLGTTCTEKTDGDVGCGLDEPSVVVDARGYVYYTAACCFLVSSPVFVSKDAGATFEAIMHPMKDAYGNEGDLAIDAEGNLYYMDIDLATFGIARWDSDQNPVYGYRRPGEPLVDRPFIRAGSDGVVHAVYNTGSDTVYYRSTDYAMTFTATPVARFGSALANAYSDVRRGIVGMVGYGDYVESTDAGATWGERTAIGGCEDVDSGAFNTESAAVDEAGTVWFQRSGCVTGRLADGTWTGSQMAVPEGIETFFTWVNAGGPGAVAVGYYGMVEDEAAARALGVEPDGWYLFVSFSTDADSASPHWATLLADPEPLGFGQLGRRLGDFMSVAVGPDGAIHLAYARNPEMDDSATASYIATTAVPGMAPSMPLVGPFDTGARTSNGAGHQVPAVI